MTHDASHTGATLAPGPSEPGVVSASLQDAGWLLLVWIALPVSVLVVGAPVVLVARLAIRALTGSW